MKKAERLNWIVMTLKQRGRMTAGQLAEYMEVSERTIYRDMTALGEIQVPVAVREGSGGGYEIDPDYFLPVLRLNDREILVLLLLLEFAGKLHLEDYRADIHTLGHKLLEVCREDPGHLREAMAHIHFDLDAIVPETCPAGVFSLIVEAFLRRRRLRLTYFKPLRGDATERTVTPLELFYADGCWYLQAFCHARGERRTFRLDRIREAAILAEAADPAACGEEPPFPEPPQAVVLEMDPRLFEVVKADEPMRGAEVVPLGDGRLEVRQVRRRLEYFEQLAFRNVAQVTVKAPASLVASIQAKFEAGFRKYLQEP